MTYLNIGCGTQIMPREKPTHHYLINDELYDMDCDWLNVDRIQTDGVDVQMDAFRYPWPLDSDAFDGALLSHIVEHIPHYTDGPYRDGFFDFFAELHRVLKIGSTAHILVPYAWSTAGMIDPTHTRYLVPGTFWYLCDDESNAPFRYKSGPRWIFASEPVFAMTDEYRRLSHKLFSDKGDADLLDGFFEALAVMINTSHEFYIQLRTI